MHTEESHTLRNVALGAAVLGLGTVPVLTGGILGLIGAGWITFKLAKSISFALGQTTASAANSLRESYEQGKLQVHPHPPIIISGFDARKFDMEEAYKRFNDTVVVIQELPIEADSKKEMIDEQVKILKGVLGRIMS